MKAILTIVLACLGVTCALPAAGGDVLMGGYSETPVTGAWVKAAAEFAIARQARTTATNLPALKIELVEIVRAEQQVVAGMNYRLRLKVRVKDEVREAEAVVWRKLSGKFKLTSWTWKQPEEKR